mmetsp:Transcript_32158/g.51145  ORF Transcript_32158/g.51145 Transcript_32158/m.51145 type:complete len:479 (-) Transcript_32158:353-1789(-)|eukprot:CAMPEP_0203757248 /NCGR_PEP_ID=MMETSP0098-20131031/10371_1 /ASSEMBLY_ACC=CAM_ASM_000208 /TAXON_ID=96639 /ORGANISM=" , Strain NY0313808BC1" /LENGTH=478 /DNA_ID=CAMNT_0050649419 /DNA_START=868 /DNA_END=2304 /DNA_ORIENTATION=-
MSEQKRTRPIVPECGNFVGVESLKQLEVYSSIGLFALRNLDINEDKHTLDDSLPPRRMTWLQVSLVQVAEVVGAGVLTMPSAFADLGWVLGIVLLTSMMLVSVYTGCAVSRVRCIFPNSFNFVLMARYSVKWKFMQFLAGVTVMGSLLTGLAAYLLAIAQSVQMCFYDSQWCTLIWLSIVTGLFVPVQIQTLSSSRWLVYANAGFILLVVLVTSIYLLMNGAEYHKEHPVTTEVWPRNLTWVKFFNGFSKMAFAYFGHYMYCELMTEMRLPEDFPKTYAIAAPFQYALYLLAGVAGYSYNGDTSRDMIIKQIPPSTHGTLLRIMALLLALHLAVTYLVQAIVTERIIFMRMFPRRMAQKNYTQRLLWFMVSTGLLVVLFFILNLVPFFGIVVGLCGSLFAPSIGLILPAVFLLGASTKSTTPLAAWESIFLKVLIVVGVVLTIAGTAANLVTFVENMNGSFRAFQCTFGSYEDNFYLS